MEYLSDAVEQGTIHLTADNTHEARIGIDGRDLMNFASCSYFGLDRDPRLISAAHAAMLRFGVQFATSPAYVTIDLYEALTRQLEKIFRAPTLVAQTTTLAHLAALPSLVTSDDLVLLDRHVHATVQMAAQNAAVRGATVQVLPHNDLGALDAALRSRAKGFDRVWYLADGVYSMHGDHAPIRELEALRGEYPTLFLYFDDAHGMSFTGDNGCGYVLSELRSRERTVVVTSLSQAFGAGGAALVFADEATRDHVRTCGPTMVFCGPLHPPLLGAALASARIHLSYDLGLMQRRLAALIEARNELLHANGLRPAARTTSPVCFLEIGDERHVVRVAREMKERGYLLSPAAYPAVPVGRAGIRFTVTVHHSKRMLDGMLRSLADCLRASRADSRPPQRAVNFSNPLRA
jgi:7-keto-8-aminopelargonate synthetase-like enzyme